MPCCVTARASIFEYLLYSDKGSYLTKILWFVVSLQGQYCFRGQVLVENCIRYNWKEFPTFELIKDLLCH